MGNQINSERDVPFNRTPSKCGENDSSQSFEDKYIDAKVGATFATLGERHYELELVGPLQAPQLWVRPINAFFLRQKVISFYINTYILVEIESIERVP